MHPYLFHLGSFALPTYGLLAALGLVAGLAIVFRLARQQRLDPDQMWNLGGLAAFSGIVGSKLLMLLVDWREYWAEPARIFSMETLQSGGVFSGGLLLAIACCWWYMRRHRIPFLTASDAFAPGIALGHAIGRLGCFSAGCCYGRECHLPWAVTFHNPLAAELSGTPLNVPLHPTQLYEFVAELINFALLYLLCQRKKFEGQIIALFMMIYGCERFVFELFRGDPGRGDLPISIMIFGSPLSGTQLIALGLIVAGIVITVRRVPLRTAPNESHKKSPRSSRA